jgi:hypothetical protein
MTDRTEGAQLTEKGFYLRWRNGDTYDLFKALWRAGAQPLADSSVDRLGNRYHHIRIPPGKEANVSEAIRKVNPAAGIIMTK